VFFRPIAIRVAKHGLVAIGRRPVQIHARTGLDRESGDLRLNRRNAAADQEWVVDAQHLVNRSSQIARM
jgi:hypothetical protein